MKRNAPAEELGVVPINQLNPYQNWTIKARCSAKSDVRTYSNARGSGKFFNFDLVDETGEIRCTCFNEVVDDFEPLIQIGNVYLISKGTIKNANARYTKAQYEMSLSKTSVVQQIQETRTSIPKKRYAFLEINRIQDMAPETLCDVIGVISTVSDLTIFFTKKDNREVKKRIVEITDKSKRSVEITLFADVAEGFEAIVGDVIILKNARINDFQGYKSLNYSSALSSLEINPDIDIVKELKKWYEENEKTLSSEVKSISSGPRTGGGGNIQCDDGNFEKLKEAIISSNDKKGVTMRIPASITWFKRDDQAPLFYKAVPNDRFKVIDNITEPSKGKYYCEVNGHYYDTYTPRFILTVSASDYSGSQILNCFDDWGKSLLGCSASDVEHLKLHDPSRLEIVFEQALFQRKVLKVRAKEEGKSDDQKIQYVISGVEDLDFAKESRRLLDKIKQLRENNNN